MKYISVVFFFIFLGFTNAYSQQAKWQQHVDYEINVKLYPDTKILEADIKIEYTNNSPDTLKSIWLHIWPNAYKNDETAFAKQFLKNGNTDFYFSSSDEKGAIDNLNFTTNGTPLAWHLDKEHIDIVEVILNQPLVPNKSITIATPFKVKLPKLFSRSGYDKGFFAITQWYPKPAVYDINGWNTMPYLDQGEFYSEFGNFKVTISVPENYMVAATGNLQTASEIANIKYYKLGANRLKTNTYKTFTYTENNIHDFAWFADTCFKITQSKAILENTKDTVTTWLYKSNNSKNQLYYKGDIMRPINNAVIFHSKNIGNYPYKNCTVVIGSLKAGGGMEYPTITICDRYNAGLIMHEVGHNWFQGIIGSNEREHPWMDESINTFFEENYSSDSSFFNNFNTHNWGRNYEDLANYLYAAEQGLTQPLNLKSDSFTNINYGCVLYGKGPIMFAYLKEKLGNKLFSKCVKNYFIEWQYKHPLPKDMQQSFERTSGKNLDWFFIELMNDNHAIDYIKRKHKDTIKNAPLLQQYIKENKIKNVSIGGYLPERNYNNNGQKSKILSLHFPWQQPVFNRTVHINISPIIAYNYYDKFYIGTLLFNRTIFRKKIEYTLMPAYAFGSKKMVGYGKINYKILPINKKIYRIDAGIQGQSFGNNQYGISNQYFRINPYVKIDFKEKGIANANIVKQLLFNFYHTGLLNTGYTLYDSSSNALNFNYDAINFMNYYKATYKFENKDKINNYGFTLNGEFGNNYKFNPLSRQYLKTWATAKYYYQYAKKKYFKTDVFAGIFIRKKGTLGNQQFFVSGNNGNTDYLYNEAMLGRNENVFDNNILGRQLINNNANMRNIFSSSGNDKWLLGANNEIYLPGIIPFNIYADFAYTQTAFMNGNTNTINYNTAELFTTMGITLPLFNGNLEIFAPIYQSKQFNNLKFLDAIGFKLKLNALNPFEIIDNMRI